MNYYNEIKNKYNYKIISEKSLQRLILEYVPAFLDELGDFMKKILLLV